jgi:hypothetical protein
VSILLVCTYKCLHFNIPSFEEKEAGWHRVKIKHWSIPYWPEWFLIRKYLQKFGWILVIDVAPELGVGVAVKEYFEACRDLKHVKERWPDLEADLVHAFYATMGGFAEALNEAAVRSIISPIPRLLEAPSLSKSGGDRASESATSAMVSVVSPSDQSQNRACASEMVQESPFDLEKHSSPPITPKAPRNLRSLTLYSYGKFPFFSNSSPAEISNLNKLSKGLLILQTVQLCQDTSSATILITKQDINDRSKTDAFTKMFAISQASWLIIQSIARVSSGLPLSQLELATMAYIVPAAVMYGFWLEKPFGVEHVTIVPCDKDKFPTRFDPWTKKSLFGGAVEDVLAISRKSWKQNVAFYTVATLFSAVHIGAWNWEFPSPVTRLLWRIFGVLATAAGPYFVVVLLALKKPYTSSSHSRAIHIRLVM